MSLLCLCAVEFLVNTFCDTLPYVEWQQSNCPLCQSVSLSVCFPSTQHQEGVATTLTMDRCNYVEAFETSLNWTELRRPSAMSDVESEPRTEAVAVYIYHTNQRRWWMVVESWWLTDGFIARRSADVTWIVLGLNPGLRRPFCWKPLKLNQSHRRVPVWKEFEWSLLRTHKKWSQ